MLYAKGCEVESKESEDFTTKSYTERRQVLDGVLKENDRIRRATYKVTADVMERMSHDKLAQMKDAYEREGVERNNAFYGYIGKTA